MPTRPTATAAWMVDRSASVRLDATPFLAQASSTKLSIAARALPIAAAVIQAAKNPNGGKSIQRPVDHRPVEYRHHALIRDKDLIGHRVVTAGAAQPEGVPRVQDL